MADLNIIHDGAVLIRDGVIEEIGTTRRVENLMPSRTAREIDAAGKIVMPAFVDPDIALASPCSWGRSEHDGASAIEPLPLSVSSEPDIRRMSRRRLERHAAAMSADLARYGVLTVGSPTLSAPDLQNANKALRLNQALQSKPLRIRSIFAPPCDAASDPRHLERVKDIWMPAIFRKKLASVLEIHVVSGHSASARMLAAAAAAIGYTIRLRLSGPATPDVLELAYSAGAVALIGEVPVNSDLTRALADVGCVKVIQAAQVLAGNVTSLRRAIDDGTPVAIASAYQYVGLASINPQFLLYLACHTLEMSVEEAIVAATYNAAYCLRFSHVTGSLAPGKAADICIIDVDHYRELARRAGHHDTYLVMRAGRVIYRRPNLSPD
jgi:imidazolonepropionase